MSSSPRVPTKHNLPFRGVDNDPAFYSALYESVPEIRYVDLHPGCPTDPIICSLGYATLDSVAEERLTYEALSYCWGSIDDTTEITLHGLPKVYPGENGSDEKVESFSGSFRVTRNLKEALLALRYEHTARRLWVDAICINQMDPTEKTHQVGHMNKIYESAEQVLVWLGPQDRHSIAVLEWCERLQCEVRDIRGDQQTFDAATGKHEDIEKGDWIILAEKFGSLLMEAEQYRRDQKQPDAVRGARELETSFVRTLNVFLGRPWFRRVWVSFPLTRPDTSWLTTYPLKQVYPEVFSAKRGVRGERLVTVHIGDMKVPWLYLVEIVHTITECDPTLFPKEGCDNLASFQNAWYWPTYGDATGCGLAEYFSRTRQLLASDPRDKIFALLHVAHDTRHRIHTDTRLLPDYNKSLLNVLIDYSRAGINLPLVMGTDRDLEANSTFFFDICTEHYDYQICTPQLISLQHSDGGPSYHPFQGSVTTIINRSETYVHVGKEVYISTSIDGRHFLSALPTSTRDAIVSCDGSEAAFILSPLVGRKTPRSRFRGCCTPLTQEEYIGHVNFYATCRRRDLQERTIMAPLMSHQGSNQGHSSACAGPGTWERQRVVTASPQVHWNSCTGPDTSRDQMSPVYSLEFPGSRSSYHNAAPNIHKPYSTGAHFPSYAEAFDTQDMCNARFIPPSHGRAAQLNPLQRFAAQYLAMSVQGHPATCNGSEYPGPG